MTETKKNRGNWKLRTVVACARDGFNSGELIAVARNLTPPRHRAPGSFHIAALLSLAGGAFDYHSPEWKRLWDAFAEANSEAWAKRDGSLPTLPEVLNDMVGKDVFSVFAKTDTEAVEQALCETNTDIPF